MRRALPFLLIAGCGWSEDHFLVTGIPEFCDAAADCVGFDAAACEDAVRAIDRSRCDYDAGAAKRCVTAVRDGEGTCKDNGDLGTFSYLGPEDCELVWDGCGPMYEVPIDEGTSPPPDTTE